MRGIITKSLSGFYYVNCDGKLIQCKARGVFRKDNLKPLVGDIVDVETNDDNTGTVVNILPRKNYLIRPPISNITQNIVVFTLKKPQVNYRFIDEILVFSEKMKIDVVLCVNKVDLLDYDYREEIEGIFVNTNYPTIFTSVKENTGIDDLKRVLKNNVNVFSGASGVGKSSLINNVLPSLNIEVGSLSGKIDRGKHTTRHVELFEIDHQSFVADAPGFGSIDVCEEIEAQELMNYFPEFLEFVRCCKYSSCLHYKEPGCAVKEALSEGKISHVRYESYLEMLKVIQNKKKY